MSAILSVDADNRPSSAVPVYENAVLGRDEDPRRWCGGLSEAIGLERPTWLAQRAAWTATMRVPAQGNLWTCFDADSAGTSGVATCDLGWFPTASSAGALRTSWRRSERRRVRACLDRSEPSLDVQRDELEGCGAVRVFEDEASGATSSRPGLEAALNSEPRLRASPRTRRNEPTGSNAGAARRWACCGV